MIFHLLSGSDMHFENIIASSGTPIPIDLEMLFQAPLPKRNLNTPGNITLNMANKIISDSVLSVGMLPAYSRSSQNIILDDGGLVQGKNESIKGEWKNINTNGMRWALTPTAIKHYPNVPHINSIYANFGDYLTDFIKGFELYGNFLLKHKDSIYFRKSLNNFKGLQIRKVIRPSRFYGLLLSRLCNYKFMGDGISWSARADFIARLTDLDSSTDVLWPLHKAERIALINLNIPYFTSLTDGKKISDSFGNFINSKDKSGLSYSIEKLKNLNLSEITWQSKLIQISTSFLPRYQEINEFQTNLNFKKIEAYSSNRPKLTKKNIRNELSNIYTTLNELAYQDISSASWIGLDWLRNSNVGKLLALGPDLYCGTSGIALFLSAYYEESGEVNAKKLALKSLISLRNKIKGESSGRFARGLGLGGTCGLGSIVYALDKISTLLKSEELLNDAIHASKLFTDELISSDKKFDVINGSAGGILALLSLYRNTNLSEVLELAVKCGEHLLFSQRSGELGKRSWISLGFEEIPLNGMSHGAAGYQYALNALAIASKREDFADAAAECKAYLDSNFDKKIGNWIDVQKSTDGKIIKKCLCQWCHGATGIGLSFIGQVRAGMSLDKFKIDIQNATLYAKQRPTNNVDTLCCGELGNVEFLYEAGRTLGDTLLLNESKVRLACIVENRFINGDFSWNAGNVEFNLGLFKGISGIGYTLLRQLNPKLPNVLIWE
jgi:type 2 lantibiotic biosynthesis protein LanM